MKRRRVFLSPPVSVERPAVRTGEHCPESGWWQPSPASGQAEPPRFIGEGSVMPASGGAPVLWRPQELSRAGAGPTVVRSSELAR